jgi:glycosyltransferase involved in cell wall biosynthesis
MNFKRNTKKNVNERSSLFENMLGKVNNKPINIYSDLSEKSKTKCFWEHENEPSIWVSLLIPSYNTKEEYLRYCINSIKEQIGSFGLEVVWINDCSNDLNTNMLVNLLDTIIRPLKNCKLLYERLEKNSGISFCLNHGVNLCSNEIIFRMDSDDIMKNDRIVKQLKFILSTPSCVMCGTNITAFNYVNGINSNISDSVHKNILTWSEYKKNPKDWILNHPTLCFKKTAILNVGNYNKDLKFPFEDLELELRILKVYGVLYNLNESLVFYRIHSGQISNKKSEQNELAKKALIQHMITS